MFSKVKSAYDAAKKNVDAALAKFHGKDDEFSDGDANRYGRDVGLCAVVLRDPGATDEDKVTAIMTMGHLAFTGGDCSKAVLEYVSKIVFVLNEANSSTRLRIACLSALGEFCISYSDDTLLNELRKLGLIQSLINMASGTGEPNLQRWACYTLRLMVSDDPTTLNIASDVLNVDLKLRRARALDWSDWNDNEANVILNILGFGDDV
ncbi:armadillo-like helical domain-containing protein 2 [Branchiostoma lanceolatum]|uniref:C6orf229 protein n=1 Tax=Branchiostoma lanceolatum TaxID=7740 RepID=A0A8K0EUR3_BRALA|nr:C6orf229 [Branchiostoma lanceolatum]